MADDAVGCINNILGRTIVAFQFHRHCFGVLAVELQDIIDVCPTKRVDALCVITNNADVVVVFREQTHDSVLGIVGVLILIDQNVTKTLCISLTHLFHFVKEKEGVEQQIIKIHGSCCATAAKILRVDAM